MGYRDELGAAKERIRVLEGELADARAENERLRNPPAKDEPAAPAAPRARKASHRVGRIYYHPPRTYFPALRMVPHLLDAARTSAPVLEPLTSNSVLDWALQSFVRAPLVIVSWPFYWLSMLLLVPIASLFCLVRAVVWVPAIWLSCLTFSPQPPPDRGSSDDESPDQARIMLWVVASILVVPMAFTWRLLRSK